MMRSLSYILGGKPANTSDCLDYAMRNKLQRIILTLHVPEEITDNYSVRWLRGSFVWFFENLTVTYEMTFGGCFMHESQDRRQISMDNANSRLAHELETIKARRPEISVEGEQLRFDPAVIAKKAD